MKTPSLQDRKKPSIVNKNDIAYPTTSMGIMSPTIPIPSETISTHVIIHDGSGTSDEDGKMEISGMSRTPTKLSKMAISILRE